MPEGIGDLDDAFREGGFAQKHVISWSLCSGVVAGAFRQRAEGSGSTYPAAEASGSLSSRAAGRLSSSLLLRLDLVVAGDCRPFDALRLHDRCELGRRGATRNETDIR